MSIPTCTLSGTLRTITGDPMSFTSIEIYPDSPVGLGSVREVAGSGFYGEQVARAVTNRAGEFQIKLLQGLSVRASVPGIDEEVKFCVPRKDTANFFDYAMPTPLRLEWVLVEDDYMIDLELGEDRVHEVEVGEDFELALAVIWTDEQMTAIEVEDYEIALDPENDDSYEGETEEGTILFNASDVRTVVLSLETPPSIDVEFLLEARTFSFMPETDYTLAAPGDLTLEFV